MKEKISGPQLLKVTRNIVLAAGIFFSPIIGEKAVAQESGISWQMSTELSRYLDNLWKKNRLDEKGFKRSDFPKHCNLIYSIVSFVPGASEYMKRTYSPSQLGEMCFALGIAAIQLDEHFGPFVAGKVAKNPFANVELVNLASSILRTTLNPNLVAQMRSDMIKIGIEYKNQFKK